MITELAVMQGIKTFIASGLNEYLDPDITPITEENVLIDFPSVDLMPKKAMIYIQPNYAEFEGLTTGSDATTFAVSVFLLNKKDTQENLTVQNHAYYEALCELVRDDRSLGETVDFCDVTEVTFYPAVEGNRNVRGVEVSLAVRYTKDFY